MFKLLIECTKDIDTLHINFSDGTSVVTSKDDKSNSSNTQNPQNPQNQPKEKPQKEITRKKPLENYVKEEYLNTDEDFSVQQEVIQKPVIPDCNRPPKISDELQNLDF